MGLTRHNFERRDAEDPLRLFRDQFHLPEGVVYLDGNSLGALPKRAQERLSRVVGEEWGEDLIRSWVLHDWIGLPERVGDKIGRLVGAGQGQVVVGDSTSVDLFKLLAAALSLRADRTVILTEQGNFPTDVYMAQGLIELLGGRHELRSVSTHELSAAIDDDTAVVMLTHVNYRTGALLDLDALTEAAHAHGALALWDLSHSVGAVPVDLDQAGADLAVGCGYKYLNGGPGAPAFVYVARHHQSAIRPALSGWMGHESPFAFEEVYRPAGGIRGLLVGTPSVLSLIALEEAVDLHLEAPMTLIRAKSKLLTQGFVDLVHQECSQSGLRLAGPEEADLRGSQVSLRHPGGYAIVQALSRQGVIGDFRTPDILRFGFAPAYLRFADVWDAVAALRAVMQQREWERPEHHARAKVT